ncbi:MAG: helix-turn-helix transcriptional regulator [Dehalococcoidales bacterium]|nr:helix-turn-helix transcriptional regulator [Dehalococcoidales bacterium]
MPIKVKLNQEAVLKAIARRNMSQNMLAVRAGISSGYISQILCGTRNPSPIVRQKLQDVLEPLTFDDIFIIEENGNGAKSR